MRRFTRLTIGLEVVKPESRARPLLCLLQLSPASFQHQMQSRNGSQNYKACLGIARRTRRLTFDNAFAALREGRPISQKVFVSLVENAPKRLMRHA